MSQNKRQSVTKQSSKPVKGIQRSLSLQVRSKKASSSSPVRFPKRKTARTRGQNQTLPSLSSSRFVLSAEQSALQSSMMGRRSRGFMGSMQIQPARSKVWLKYVENLLLATTGGASKSFAYPIQSNNAFAVDSAAAAPYTTTPGFSVKSIAYSSYRVLRYRGIAEFAFSVGTSPPVTSVCHSNSALGASAGGTLGVDVLQFAALRPGFNTIKESNGLQSTKIVHRYSHTVPSITGESTQQPGYKSLTNTGPAIPTYIVYGITFPTNVNQTVELNIQHEMEVEFLDYIDTLTSLYTSAQSGRHEFPMCGGCKFLSSVEMEPCTCGLSSVCTSCWSTWECSLYQQVPNCTRRQICVPVHPPQVQVNSSSSTRSSFDVSSTEARPSLRLDPPFSDPRVSSPVRPWQPK